MQFKIDFREIEDRVQVTTKERDIIKPKKSEDYSTNKFSLLEIVGVGHELVDDKIEKLIYFVYEHYTSEGDRLNTHEVHKFSSVTGDKVDEVSICRGRADSRVDMMDRVIYES